MRISTPYQYDSTIGRMRDAQERYYQAQNQVLTGKRFHASHEDPVATNRILTSSNIKNRLGQMTANLRSARDYIGTTENALTDTQDLLRSAYSMAIQGASSAVDSTARSNMANQVYEMRRRLVAIANSQGSHGQYIFSGHLTGTKPFTETPPSLTYNGDNNAVTVEVRPAEFMQVNIGGSGAFFTDIYNELTDLANRLMSGDIQLLSQDSVKGLQDLGQVVSNLRGAAGVKSQTLTEIERQNQRRIDELTKDISDAQEVDMAEAITKYQQAENAYTAALQVTSRSFDLSLMDFLR